MEEELEGEELVENAFVVEVGVEAVGDCEEKAVQDQHFEVDFEAEDLECGLDAGRVVEHLWMLVGVN